MSATLAEKNGRVAFESGRPLNESNPYRRGTPLFDLFMKGWNAAASAQKDRA